MLIIAYTNYYSYLCKTIKIRIFKLFIEIQIIMKKMKGFGSVLTIWGMSLLILAMFFVMFQMKAEGISFYILVLVILVALGVIDVHAWKIFREA